MRRFASKRERRALWRASGGVCAICGCDLTADFHADHIKPFSKTNTTNVHEMQALCAPCNARKGKHMWRKHQQAAIDIAAEDEFGRSFNRILAAVTPGGGKSCLPIIFGNAMIKNRLASKICWVVPRDSLRKQAEREFSNQRYRGLLGHNMTIRAAGNDVDPSRGTDGYATTYHAISCDPDLHRHEFQRHRYLLVLDEVHHVAEDGDWHRALRPMVDLAAGVVLLSGTLSRADGQRIAFVDYEMDRGGEVPCLSDTDTTRIIRYTRTDALTEQAVLPIYFERTDGSALWMDNQAGSEDSVNSLRGAGDLTSKALHTALREEYALGLMGDMIDHWRGHVEHNPRAKFLVVAPNIVLARSYLNRLRTLGVQDVDIAVSDDGKEAKDNIERLKGNPRYGSELSGLVTVAMAYEGLDCPQITHIACLTHIRSHEWIEQMLARATRVDYGAGPYSEQSAYVWAPDDDLFSSAIEKIQAEQARFLKQKRTPEEGAQGGGIGGAGGNSGGPNITPLGANVTGTRSQDGQTNQVVDAAEHAVLREVMKRFHIRGISPLQFREAVKATESGLGSVDAARTVEAPDLTYSEKEAKLRKEIDRKIKRLGGGDGERIKAINAYIKRLVRVERAEANMDQLRTILRFVEEQERLSGRGDAPEAL